MALDSPFGAPMYPIPSGKENGLTTPLPGISTPALNTPPTPNEQVGIAWRGAGYTEAVDSAHPANVDSVFNGGDPFGIGSMDQSSGGGGATNGALDTPFGTPMWQKP